MSTPAQGPNIASSTPLLDRVSPLPRGETRRKSDHGSLIAAILSVLLILIFAALSALRPFSWFMDRIIDEMFAANFRGYRSWLMPFYGFLAFVLAVVVHEIGHLICGLCCGLRLNFISFWRLRIRPPFRISVKENRLSGASGLTSMIPTKVDGVRSRTLIMTAGGPLANLLSALMAFYILAPHFPFAAWYVPVAAFLGIANLVPFHNKSTTSDGMKIWKLIRRGLEVERTMALSKLVSDLSNGIDPEELSRDFLAKATAIRDDSAATVIAHWLGYKAIWEQDKDLETAEFLEVCLRFSDWAPLQIRKAVMGDAAIFQAQKRKRVDLAEHWLADIEENAENLSIRLWVESAILDTQGDVIGALQKLDEYEKVVVAAANLSHKAPKFKSLNKWRSELRAKLATKTHVSTAARHPG